MNRALATRNYEGTFFHLSEGRVETMRIVHRFRAGRVTERLLSLDGSGREFVRNNDELTCYLPDQHTVLVIPNSTVRRDFTLQSGNVTVTPSRLDARVDPAGSDEQDLTVKNTVSPPYSLRVMTVVALVFLPIVVCYQIWSYYTFRKRLSVPRVGGVESQTAPTKTPAATD